MVSIESFLELVKKRDIGRIKFAIRETNFDINSKDEVSLDLNHHKTCNHRVMCKLVNKEKDIPKIYLVVQFSASISSERKTVLYLLVRYSLA